jgi:succinate dehydrogenase / fumarate reductase membrane anchor subunit
MVKVRTNLPVEITVWRHVWIPLADGTRLSARIWLPKDAMGYDRWAAIFSSQWMKVLTFTLILSLAYHAWVGVRDIWMDYVKPVGLRLVLHVFTLVWLVACTGWAVQVLWRL